MTANIDELYQDLANAIVVRAADDYRDEFARYKMLEQNEPPYESKVETFKAPTKKKDGSVTIEMEVVIPAGAEPEYKYLDGTWYKIFPSNMCDVGIPITPPEYVAESLIKSKEDKEGYFQAVLYPDEKSRKKQIPMEFSIPAGEDNRFTFLGNNFTAPVGKKSGYIPVVMPGGTIVSYPVTSKTKHEVKQRKSGKKATVYSTELGKFSIMKDNKKKKGNKKKVTDKEDKEEEMTRYDMWKNKMQNCKKELTSIEQFFHSQWYVQLTDVDGEWLFNQLKQEVGNYDN